MRTIIIGGPSRGKSTLADEMHRATGVPVYCGDPASTVRYQHPYTHYLPEGLDFHGDASGSPWVALNWFPMPGPWVCEGHVMARSLTRWLKARTLDSPQFPCDRIIVLDRSAHRPETKGQAAMHVGVMTTWRKIAPYFAPITETRRHH